MGWAGVRASLSSGSSGGATGAIGMGSCHLFSLSIVGLYRQYRFGVYSQIGFPVLKYLQTVLHSATSRYFYPLFLLDRFLRAT